MTITAHLTVSLWGYLALAGVVAVAVGWTVEEVAVRRSYMDLLSVGNWIFNISSTLLAALAVLALLRLGFLR